MSKKVEDYIKKEKEMLDRAIVATPSRGYLEDFAIANKGSNDILLMQFAINFAYNLALDNIKDSLKNRDT